MKIDGVFSALREEILGGVWTVGENLPNEHELAQRFDCSAGTVNKAVGILAHEGLVVRRNRAGTRVIRNTLKSESSMLELDAVAFIYPSEQHEGIRRISQGFQEAAHAVQRRVIMLSTGADYRKEGEIVGRLNEFDVKGAVVYPVLPTVKDRLYFAQMLSKCAFPVVLTEVTLSGFGRPAVVFDGFHAGYTMTRHFIEQGLQRIGYLSDGAWCSTVQNCYNGYHWALEEAGISSQPDWTQLEPNMNPDFQNPVTEGRTLTRQYLENASDLEGVVCGNDFLALSCLESAHELGIRVPEDLRLVGIDDFASSAQSDPPLTTYHIPFEEIGRQSFQTLDRLLQGKELSTTEISLRGSLVARKSG